MKKFAAKAVASAVGVVCAGLAHAGSITAPATTAKYAVESLVSTTDITLPTVVYRMGVARTTAQDFTVIITPAAGSTFTAASCTAAVPTVTLAGTATGAFTATVKRTGTTECAYEVDVTTAFSTPAANDHVSLNFAGLVLDTHNLATAGSTAGITLGLKDLGETAFIDNSGTLSANVATSGNALTLTAAADTATKADVDDEQGPLFGFVTVGDDANAVAKASFVIGNNTGATTWLLPDNATVWDFTLHGTKITTTVTGNFQGLATNGFIVDHAVGADATLTGVTAASTSAVFEILPAQITAGQTNSTVGTTFTSARTASLGTSRVFGVSAVADVVTGADVTLAGNSTWWTWGANASQLVTPYFTLDSRFLSRFFFLNTGSAAVKISATCYGETGNTVTSILPANTELAANGQTAINASTVCSATGNTRGAVLFTINAPINAVKGSYQTVDPVTLNNMIVPLSRPYTASATTE